VLGVRLRLVRVARGLSQRQIADAAGLHSTVIGRIERGEVNFGIDYLPRLARALGIRGSWLLLDTDYPYPSLPAVPEHDEAGRTVEDWERAFIAKSISAPRGPYIPHDLVVALDAAPLATVETFLSELEARAGEDIPAAQLWVTWERMTSARPGNTSTPQGRRHDRLDTCPGRRDLRSPPPGGEPRHCLASDQDARDVGSSLIQTALAALMKTQLYPERRISPQWMTRATTKPPPGTTTAARRPPASNPEPPAA
jgi:transcriptional regulator with XRE-family HTH domain